MVKKTALASPEDDGEEKRSIAQIVAELDETERARILEGVDPAKLAYDWKFWGRPSQFVEEGTFIHAIIAGRGYGKLFSLSTPILLANGTWTTMGDLKDGDVVFDENGKATTVIKAHTPEIPEKMYRLHFSDGTYLDAGEEHQWVTWTHADRKSYLRQDGKRQVVFNEGAQGFPENWPTWTRYSRWGVSTGVGPKVRTTQEIVDTFRYGKRGDLNHSIPLSKALDFPQKKFLVPPEVLGQWLGDGTASKAEYTQHRDDCHNIERALTAGGYLWNSRKERNKENTHRISVRGLKISLREVGVLNNKHIPRAYLSASVDQRKDLLAGLMDTDGTIHKDSGYAEYCTILPQLADDVMELLRGLGEKPVLKRSESYLYGVRKKDRYRITWRPKFNPFRLERKRALWRPLGAQAFRNYHRMIVDFEVIEPVLSRCITVDSPNSMYLAGRALIPTHNTRTSSEWVREKAIKYPGCRIALVGRTTADVIGTMINGESGIIAVHPEEERPEHQVSKRRLVWPNGSIAETFSSQEPSQLRGPQFHFAACDETGSWLHVPDDSGLTAWDNVRFATRLRYFDMSRAENVEPQILVTTTPKKTDVIIDLFEEAEKKPDRVKIVSGSTFENKGNLSAVQIEELVDLYGDSPIGRQELYGELLGDIEGVMWTDEMIEAARLYGAVPPHFPIRIVAVDPSMSDKPRDECGIIVLGITGESQLSKRHAYILHDASGHMSPKEWAPLVVKLAEEYNADIVVEKNQGGDMLPMTLHAINPNVRVHTVWAKGSKAERTEPIVMRYRQKRVHHVGAFTKLENQMVTWDPEHSKRSPDRIDALNWGVRAGLISPPEGLGPSNISVRKTRAKMPSRRRGARRLPAFGLTPSEQEGYYNLTPKW